MKRRVLLGVSAASIAIAACQLFVNLDDEPGVPRPSDSGSSSGAEASAFDPCQHVRIPAEPPVNAPAGDDLPPITFAARRYVVKPVSGVVGYDLDGLCTGIDATPAATGCVPSGKVVVDGDGGIDNGFALAVSGFPISGDVAADFLATDVNEGIFTILVQLSRWNGGPDDSDVTVAMFTSSTLCRGYCFDGGEELIRPRPQWDGGEEWSYDENIVPVAVREGRRLVTEVSPGYVSKGTLVVKGGTSVLHFGLGTATITLQSPTLTANIVRPDDGGKALLSNGIITGVAPAGETLSFIDRVRLSDTPVCKRKESERGPLIRAVCGNRDLNSDGSPDGPCDALSFALGFDAEESALGPATLTPLDDPCDGAPPPSCSP